MATAGVHPFRALEGCDGLEDVVRGGHRALVAIGECGLDGSEGFPGMEEQVVVFAKQLDLACTYKTLPLFMHERLAHREFMGELSKRKDELPGKLLVHCFTGDADELKTYLDFGCYVSVAGVICRDTEDGRRLRQALEKCPPPPNRLLIETDAPYLGFKGCRRYCAKDAKKASPNEPSALILVAQALAQCLNRNVEDVCEDSCLAAEEFFGLPKAS